MAPDDSSKAFIVKHMNADHQDSLSLYLRVYNNVPSSDAKSARLEDLSLTDLVITASGTRYTVPITPPMKSFSDARSRVVTMQKECLAKLGVSDIVVTEYKAPHGVTAVTFTVCLTAYVLFCRRSNFLPGSLVYDWVFAKAPAAAESCYNIQPLLFPGLLASHTLESVLLAFKRLRRHQVPALSGVWCAWMVSTFIEGFGAWQRFDGMIKEKQRKSS